MASRRADDHTAGGSSTTHVLGVVLAAGAGRRMGGPKALVGPLASGTSLSGREGSTHPCEHISGVSPLERVCGWVHQAGVDTVLGVIGSHADQVRAVVPARPWLVLVEATAWAEGMGASLRAGLQAASECGADAVLVTLVDLPDVRTPVYRRFLTETRLQTNTLARASFHGTPGHPVLIGRKWWPLVTDSAQGDQGARAVFANHPHVLVECGDLATGRDVDTPQG